MKNLNCLNEYRVTLYGSRGDEGNGAFEIRIKGDLYRVIASNGGGWEHVSITPWKENKTPSWAVMCALKDLFFEPEEIVIQLHPRRSEYVNYHPYCLHLWRPINSEIPTPPAWMVGPIK